MTTTDTPQNACPHCGDEVCAHPQDDPAWKEYRCGTVYGYYPSDLCREREKSQKLEAEVERLRSQLKRAVEIAETSCQYLNIGGWNEDEIHSGKDGWVTETEINEVCASLALLKAEIK